MTGLERIGGTPPVTATSAVTDSLDAASVARGTMAAVGDRVLAWTADSFSTGNGPAAAWSAQTGGAGGFTPDRAELSRGGDVYQLRALTAEVAQHFGATPAEEGALGRAVEDFARGVSLRFNALAGGPADQMVGGVADALDRAATSDGPGGIDGVTTRIESAARMVETLNR